MRVIIFTGLLLFCLLATGCSPGNDLDYHLSSIVKPYQFDFVGWEFRALQRELNPGAQCSYQHDDEIQIVREYFSATERAEALKKQIEATSGETDESNLAALKAELSRLQEQKLALQGTVERIIEKQLRETLTRQGIFNPAIGLRISFPPINFKLERPPCLLVVSPRDRIESLREITLRQDLRMVEMEDIEAEVDRLGVSSLVVELGGLGATYPTFVANNASLRFTLDTVAEEWLHQYLAFKPLGFLYVLDVTGISRNYEIATINETVAGIFSREIGDIIYQDYYARYDIRAHQNQEAEGDSDFNHEMREIRKTVDTYLSRGEIEQAEAYMEQKRQYLASIGYCIRKLNQAYFAFHGTYADRPAFVSPIGLEVKTLRAQSTSLKDFLEAASAITSRQHLRDSIR